MRGERACARAERSSATPGSLPHLPHVLCRRVVQQRDAALLFPRLPGRLPLATLLPGPRQSGKRHVGVAGVPGRLHKRRHVVHGVHTAAVQKCGKGRGARAAQAGAEEQVNVAVDVAAGLEVHAVVALRRVVVQPPRGRLIARPQQRVERRAGEAQRRRGDGGARRERPVGPLVAGRDGGAGKDSPQEEEHPGGAHVVEWSE